ncbi:phosphoenolpyruvate-protein phosphotransferase [Deinococcus phoenicis]|uniref:Phosphoenolpyruvate-protein phosphotransferase n=1 Tax=Deinococcus phoenicis TaxID=1476583 RepID=A0A016QTV1_9DEIO|nr:phosphoenolpyruvate--protein phosphotransferase [Deinococcus phoenicis]EYB69219.1 phosphoenolpyruvate-protein phosphotransferase [Deinococcus phoenicis]
MPDGPSSPLTGIAASPGLGVGPAFVLLPPDLTFETRSGQDAAAERARLEAALAASRADIERIRERARASLGDEHAAIFDAHLLLLSDPELDAAITAGLNGGLNAEAALVGASDTFITMFESLDDPYLRERAADLRDVRNRVLAHLLGKPLTALADLREPAVIVAHDLAPSDTAQLDRSLVRGVVTAVGGRTSHSAIMARGLGLPAVVGVGEALHGISPGTVLLVDGDAGRVSVNPEAGEVAAAQVQMQRTAEERARLTALAGREGRTADGLRVELAANIGSPADLPLALEAGAEGVGLYRTEFLYLGRDTLPDEEEQYRAYRAVLEGMAGRPVVIRTLDVGGDKALPALNLPPEENPFLGFRAIRLCLARPDLFRVQLRALLRASVHGDLRVMFPMIATVQEFRAARALLDEERARLTAEGVPVAEHIQVGMMVEIPAAAVLSRQFAREADFFSIGSNDLIGYALAADRLNEQVANLYQPLNPAILALIGQTCAGAATQNRWVGVCGEMAGDPLALPLLVGLGVTELSMSAPALLPRREQVLKLDAGKARELAAHALTLDTAQEVEAAVRSAFPELAQREPGA